MRLLFRIAFIWIILGLIVGFVLRRRLGGERLGRVYLLSLAPWLGHVGYTSYYTLSRANDLAAQLLIFVVASAVLVLTGFWSARRLAWTQPSQLTFVPLGLVLIYAVPLIWFSTVLRGQAIGMNAIPTAVLVGAAFFASSVLGVFTLGLERRGYSLNRLLQRRK